MGGSQESELFVERYEHRDSEYQYAVREESGVAVWFLLLVDASSSKLVKFFLYLANVCLDFVHFLRYFVDCFARCILRKLVNELIEF